MKHALLFFAVFVVLAGLVSAQELTGLQKIQAQNDEVAKDVLKNTTFLLAFLAGITTLFSPCVLPLIPAFFAVTFKEREAITKMLLVFFLGFTIMFVLMGLIAVIAGKAIVKVFPDVNWLVPAAGIFLIAIGIFSFFGKGFQGLITKQKKKKDIVGIFIAGIVFAIGWTACVGPILSGVLIMASVFRNYFTATYLMIAYSFGIFIPLFLLSFFYDKFKLSEHRWLKGKEVTIGSFKLHTHNMIAGGLFILAGLVFIFYKGTGIINGFQMLGIRTYFYSIQRIITEHWWAANAIGIILFILAVYGIWKYTRR